MRKLSFWAAALFCTVNVYGQEKMLTVEKNNAATPIKSQDQTGTCWSFSTTSLLESECLRKGVSTIDISEMYTVRNIYIDKAKNYIRRQGSARFDEGGLGHDVIHAAAENGIMPESAYSGKNGGTMHNHGAMVTAMKTYLDSLLKHRPVPENWLTGFTAILDTHMGQPPANFEYNGKNYTPITFAKEVVKFDPNEYVMLTSFTHHPFYQSFILEVPDNFSNGAYYNVPLKELIDITKKAVQKGYTVMWDADVSNRGWKSQKGYALLPPGDSGITATTIDPDLKEGSYTQESRQDLYEKLVTQDDHLMHITGLEKSKNGKTFFKVKNSWGVKSSPFEGYVNVSEPYFAINTITIIVPKAALDKEIKNRVLAANVK